ncbi:MAG: hypothetical protein ACKO3W_09675 [bacterium]
MSRPTAIHRMLVTAFAAWMLFCCCEKRLFAALFFPDAVTSFSCCPSDGAKSAALTEEQASLPPCCRACTTTDSDAGCSERVTDDETESRTADEPSRDRAQHQRCCDGCCTKAPSTASTHTLDRDEIGRELPPFLAQAYIIEDARAASSAFDRSDGRPPPRWRTPRLQLVTTARLRI